MNVIPLAHQLSLSWGSLAYLEIMWNLFLVMSGCPVLTKIRAETRFAKPQGNVSAVSIRVNAFYNTFVLCLPESYLRRQGKSYSPSLSLLCGGTCQHVFWFQLWHPQGLPKQFHTFLYGRYRYTSGRNNRNVNFKGYPKHARNMQHLDLLDHLT